MQTTSLRKRECHLDLEMLAKAPDPSQSLQEFYRALPRVGRATELFAAAEVLTQAALHERGILWLVDAHAIECGLSPLIIRMVQRGLIRALAMTGKAAVRDYELAVFGMAQEDVGDGLRDGLLGMARETGEGMNAIINEGIKRGFGLGECLGRGILDRRPKYYAQSVLAACVARLVPCTVHVSVGADGFQRHPVADVAMLSRGSMRDLQVLGRAAENLNKGGVLAAIHHSAALHEVFYQGFAAGRNVGRPIEDFSLIQFGTNPPDFDDLPGVDKAYRIPGPLELIVPFFTGVLFSLVE